MGREGYSLRCHEPVSWRLHGESLSQEMGVSAFISVFFGSAAGATPVDQHKKFRSQTTKRFRQRLPPAAPWYRTFIHRQDRINSARDATGRTSSGYDGTARERRGGKKSLGYEKKSLSKKSEIEKNASARTYCFSDWYVGGHPKTNFSLT